MKSYIDPITIAGLHWDEVWKSISTVCDLGVRYKAELKPFLPGEVREWTEEMKAMSQLYGIESIAKLKHVLVEINDVGSILSLLRKGYAGTVSEWYLLKQFLMSSHSFFQIINKWENRTTILDILHQLLSMLNSNGKFVRTFALDDLQDESLQVLRQKKLHTERNQRELRTAWENRLMKELDYQWKVLPLFISNHDKEIVDRLLRHPSFVKITETPFEIGFDVVPSTELKKGVARLEEIKNAIETKERELLQGLQKKFIPYIDLLMNLHQEIGLWDWRLAKVEWARKVNAVRPNYNQGNVILHEGRHPYFESILGKKNKPFVPVTIELKQGVTTIVGPNMGGKSMALKTVAIAVLLFQYGLWIPAASFEAYFFPRVRLIAGDHEGVESGLSTFGAEMVRLKEVLEGQGDLLLFDEIARGTNPEEGSRLARALADYLTQMNFCCVMVTHYETVLQLTHIQVYRLRGLTEIGMEQLSIDYRKALEHGIDYRLQKVTNGVVPQQAVLIAQALGIPQEIIERAKN